MIFVGDLPNHSGLQNMDFDEMCRKLLSANENILYVSVINNRGRPLEEASRDVSGDFCSEYQKEMLMMQCALTISMGRDFDDPFGEIKYVHIDRAGLSLFSFPMGENTLLVTSRSSTGSISLARDVAAVIRGSTARTASKGRTRGKLVAAIQPV